ncbi:MAG: hypothetical protein ACYCQH_11540 [Acidithiobacillus ferrooxidans]|jgi:hypothetical protein
MNMMEHLKRRECVFIFRTKHVVSKIDKIADEHGGDPYYLLMFYNLGPDGEMEDLQEDERTRDECIEYIEGLIRDGVHHDAFD